MQLHFNSISEPSRPGPKWRALFNTFWPAYHAWYTANGSIHTPDLQTSQAALGKYMPEMVPTYERLCKLVNADEVSARFLTGFQPPAYINGCSQAVLATDIVQLVRNYDYHPDLFEGTLFLSAWNGKKVITNSDCLSGAVDGMNEDGLVISLAFGGRQVVGEGFGISFILRYVLEFCSNVEEAIGALARIPSHMSYNLTVLDRTGSFKTVRLAPDRPPVFTDAAFTTNHQETVDWPENALFNKTVERAAHLENILSENLPHEEALTNAFLQPPLYSNRFAESFGTLYTAVYRPMEGTLQLRWPTASMQQSFDNFREESKVIKFNVPYTAPVQDAAWEHPPAGSIQWVSKETNAAKHDGPPKTLLGKAFHEAWNSWEKLTGFLWKSK